MDKKKLFLFSGMIGLVAVLLVNSYVSTQKSELLKLSTPITVVVAARDLPEGTRLQDDMLDVIEVPKNFVQPDVAKSLDEVRDRQISVPLLKGTQLLGSMLSIGQNIGLAQKIPKDSLAMTVAVNNTSGVAGLIQPGDVVDISLTVEVVKKAGSAGPNGNQQEITELVSKKILSNVTVLAVDQRSYRSQSSAGVGSSSQQKGSSFAFSKKSSSQGQSSDIATVTFALNDTQVSKLSLAQELGSISLALHSSWNEKEAVSAKDGRQIGEYELLGIDKPIKKNQVDVFYGANRSKR